MRGEPHGPKILAALAAGPMTCPVLAASIGKKSNNIQHAMLQLVDTGAVIRTGVGRRYTYRLAGTPPPRGPLPVSSVWDYAKRGGL